MERVRFTPHVAECYVAKSWGEEWGDKNRKHEKKRTSEDEKNTEK